MENIKIFIATHKKVDMPKEEGYIPIQVGAEGKEDLGYQKDNQGENISFKNANYCELTALYWMWKNVKCDIIGLVHYRRYFFKKQSQHSISEILPISEIEKIIEGNSYILPEKTHFGTMTVQEEYAKYHNEKDLKECVKIVEEKFPSDVHAFKRLLIQKSMHPYNMFIMRKSEFDSYMQWLFAILEELETRIDISQYTDYNKRIYGFLSERLFNVWIANHHKKIQELPVYNTEDGFIKQFIVRKIKKMFCMEDEFYKKIRRKS